MVSKKRFQYNDEVDLLEIIMAFWENKWKIFLTMLLSIGVALFFHITQPPTKVLYETKTEIRPISIFSEVKYEFYNSYLGKFGNSYDTIRKNTDQYNVESNKKTFSSFPIIDRSFLIDLFLDKLKQTSIHIKSIKEFELIKKENYLNIQDYENEIIKLVSKIKLEPSEDLANHWNIIVQTTDTNKWFDYLKFVEKIINQEIQLYLVNTFKRLLINEKKLIKYEIEDIELKISNRNEVDKESNYRDTIDLEIMKKILITNKDVERFEDILSNTPIMEPDNFFAAKVMINSSELKSLSKKEHSLSKKLILASIWGFFLGLLYVFFTKIIGNRK